jgi:hypothetical protein
MAQIDANKFLISRHSQPLWRAWQRADLAMGSCGEMLRIKRALVAVVADLL